LPSLDELFKVCSTGGNTVPNNNSSNFIWAADKSQVNGYNDNYAMYFRLSDGYFQYRSTGNIHHVRCVR